MKIPLPRRPNPLSDGNMADPLRTLKYLPWRSLLQVAGITIAIVTAVEFMLSLGVRQPSIISRTLKILFQPPLGLLVTFFIGVGVGALAVYLLERFYTQVTIHTNTLWASIACLILVLWVRLMLPIPSILLSLNEIQAVAMIVGIFWKGKPYWR